jgi:hypothetical protein
MMTAVTKGNAGMKLVCGLCFLSLLFMPLLLMTPFFGEQKYIGKELKKSDTAAALPYSSTSVSSTTNNPKALCPTKCSKILGQNGTWIQDWNYSATHGQYPSRVTPHGPFEKRTHGKFQPSDDAPFPWPTSFRWVDSNSLDEGCQIDYTMHAATFCDVLLKLDIGRVLFSGDSLARGMRFSLLNMMGKENVQSFSNEDHLICKEKSIPIAIHKGTGGYASRNSPHVRNITFDNVTRELIQSSPNRVLGIYNIGAHYREMDMYTNDFDQLLEFLEQYHRPHDLVFFRTTPPGHRNCEPRNPRSFDFRRGTREHPLASLADYKPTKTYSWNLFQEYNAYSLKRVQEHSKKMIVPIHMLDVYNMTLLRRDGHAGGEDCLHYVDPGPVDWWNHLLFTHLKELSAAEERVN